jgi:hypothetical protein
MVGTILRRERGRHTSDIQAFSDVVPAPREFGNGLLLGEVSPLLNMRGCSHVTFSIASCAFKGVLGPSLG